VLQFVALVCVCELVCVHAVDEVIICGVIMFLWVKRVAAYNQIYGCGFSKYVERECIM
jgi:hypothetical protein